MKYYEWCTFSGKVGMVIYSNSCFENAHFQDFCLSFEFNFKHKGELVKENVCCIFFLNNGVVPYLIQNMNAKPSFMKNWSFWNFRCRMKQKLNNVQKWSLLEFLSNMRKHLAKICNINSTLYWRISPLSWDALLQSHFIHNARIDGELGGMSAGPRDAYRANELSVARCHLLLVCCVLTSMLWCAISFASKPVLNFAISNIVVCAFCNFWTCEVYCNINHTYDCVWCVFNVI